MRPDNADPYARLEAWRAQGGAQQAPLQFALADALARRARQREGARRARLEQRLMQRLDAADQVIDARPVAAASSIPAISPLQAVLQHLQHAPRLDGTSTAPLPRGDRVGNAGASNVALPAGEGIDTGNAPVLEEFQQLWSQVRIDALLHECLESAPEDAGPLHSSVLLHRAMTQMRHASPAYLQHFIAYVDALSWMEKITAPAVAAATRASTRRKPASGTRRRKEQG